MNNNNENYPSRNARSQHRLVVRVASHTLSFLKTKSDGEPEYIPYVAKTGMSVAANLRTAFREEEGLVGTTDRVLLSVCSPVTLIPLEEYMDKETFDAAFLYSHVFPGHEHEEVVCNVLPDVDAVAMFGVNKDLKLVVTDNFRDVRIQHVMQPVWEHLYRRSTLVSQRRKLYGYFHDGMLDIFTFHHRRLRFSNAFSVGHTDDALYYLLVVWKQLGLNAEDDELHVVGNNAGMDELINKLKKFVRRVYLINPSSDLNRAPVSRIDGVEYDMMLLA